MPRRLLVCSPIRSLQRAIASGAIRRLGSRSRVKLNRGGGSPPRLSLASRSGFGSRRGEPEKLPLPRLGYGTLRLVYPELETVCDEVRDALHHSLSRSFTADVDVTVIGVAPEVVTASL